jgi:hypothetical protein
MSNVPLHQMLDDLRFIKLKDRKRAEVNAAKFLLEQDGSLPLEMVNAIRKLYNSNSRKLAEMHKAEHLDGEGGIGVEGCGHRSKKRRQTQSTSQEADRSRFLGGANVET